MSSNSLKKILKKFAPYLCIAMVSAFSLGIFFNSGYPDTNHDFVYHSSSVIGLAENEIPDLFTAKILGFFANNIGYGEGLFYPPLSHICAALIYKVVAIFGLSIFTAFKIFFFLCLFFSGFFFYQLMLLFSPRKKNALFATFIYITSPYLVTDITVRCAIAETMVFVFLPVLLIGLYHLIHGSNRRFLLIFTIGAVGLIHSHLVLSFFTAILFLIGFSPSLKQLISKQKLPYILASLLTTILLSLPFLVPLYQNKTNYDYMVFQPNFMVSAESIDDFRLPPDNLFSVDKSLQGKVPLYVSIFGCIATVFSLVFYRRIKTKQNAPFLLFAIIITIICLIFSSTLVSWKYFPSFILMIQFSWRLLAFVCFGMSILTGLCLPLMEKRWGTVTYVLIAISCYFSVAQVNNYLPTPRLIGQEELIKRSAINIDYLPVCATTDNHYVLERTREPISDDGGVVFTEYENHTPKMSFKVSNITKKTTIILPRYYYLGYDIVANYQDGSIKHLEYSANQTNPDCGLISFEVDQDAFITIDYPGTKTQRITYWIAGLTTLTFVGYAIYCAPRSKVL